MAEPYSRPLKPGSQAGAGRLQEQHSAGVPAGWRRVRFARLWVLDVPAPDAAAMVAGGRAVYVDDSEPLTVPAPAVCRCLLCGAITVRETYTNFCARHGHWE
jgi:hypothetical protein